MFAEHCSDDPNDNIVDAAGAMNIFAVDTGAGAVPIDYTQNISLDMMIDKDDDDDDDAPQTDDDDDDGDGTDDDYPGLAENKHFPLVNSADDNRISREHSYVSWQKTDNGFQFSILWDWELPRRALYAIGRDAKTDSFFFLRPLLTVLLSAAAVLGLYFHQTIKHRMCVQYCAAEDCIV